MKGDKKRKGKKKPARDSVSQVVNVYVTRKQGQPKQKQPSAPLAPIPYMPRQGYAFEPLVKSAVAQVVPADNRLETLLRQMEERMKPIEVKAKQEAQEAEPTREMIAEAQSSSVGGESSGGESSGGPTASSARRDLVAQYVSQYGRPDLRTEARLTRERAREISGELGEMISDKVKKKKRSANEVRDLLGELLEKERAYYNLP
jgi:hypothetical protein